ncbi:hypothetical protein EBN03_24835 [Nocardia stercoris]|uniref:Uncharacterized protein n=1 Tax=Nocardia stercoris TaxID=2483361 RepID=A0A3M2KVL7_9NOCA|nr:hypothetical protein EBN03_24835 [Nocardia stercoris]
MTAVALQGVAAATASATETAIYPGCVAFQTGQPCYTYVVTTGADALSPVTVTVNGVTKGTATPQAMSGGPAAVVEWSAPGPGVYQITATQGTSTLSQTLYLCPLPIINGPEGMSSGCMQDAGSAQSPSILGLVGSLLFPLSEYS